MRALVIAPLLVVVLACGDDGGAARDAAPPEEDAGPEACTVPATECPPDQPYATAACATTAPCTYADPDGTTTWTYTCEAGAWTGTNDCDPPPGGACPVGPLAEVCRSPFTGTLAGATVEIGPPGGGAFRPFAADERIVPIVGGQGAPMVAFRVRATGAGVARCVSATTTLALEGVAQPATERTLTLHCGESLAVFEIIGGDVCRPGPFTLSIRVVLDGVGDATATVTFDEVACFG